MILLDKVQYYYLDTAVL